MLSLSRSYSVNDLECQDASTHKRTESMAELQATIEFSVELTRFYNVDLFQRGYYQIKTVLKTPPKSPARIEISDNKDNAQSATDGSAANSQAFTQTHIGTSQKFQILYRSEEVDLAEIFVYRIHTLVESSKLERNLENLDLRLDMELWCNDDDESSDSDCKMECVSTRSIQLNLSPTKGLHHAVPVLFDYFHLSAVDVVVHGTVIAIHQPYLTMPKAQRGSRPPDHSTLEAVYFGQKLTPSSSSTSIGGTSGVRMQQAHLMHKTICNILLSAHESLQDNLQAFAQKIPGHNFQLDKKDCHGRLGETILKVQGVMEEEDLIQTAITDITQLCAENVILWAQFLEIVLKQPKIHLHLSQEHHSVRVRRFAEGFFTMEHNKSSCLSCYDPGVHGHSALASTVKASPYFTNIPALPLHCPELDGEISSLPVVFEDLYKDARAQLYAAFESTTQSNKEASSVTGSPRQRSSSNSSSSQSQASSDRQSPHMRKRSGRKKFIKNMRPDGFKRPSSYYCNDPEAGGGGGGGGSKTDSVASKESGVMLIGYKKVTMPEVPPNTSIYLGTLSPDSPDHLAGGAILTHQLSKASSSSSLSNIFPSACMNRGSQESIPESSTVIPSHHQLHSSSSSGIGPDQSTLSISTTSSHVHQHGGGGGGLSQENSSSNIATHHQTSVSSVSSVPSNATLEPPSSSSSITTNNSPNVDVKHVTLINCKDENAVSKEQYGQLASDITTALGEKEEGQGNQTSTSSSKLISAIASINTDDFSDDDESNSNVANGYVNDDLLQTYSKDFSQKQLSTSQQSSSTADLPLTPESKTNDSALGSEMSSQEETSHSPSMLSSSASVQTRDGDKSVEDSGVGGGVGDANPRQRVTVIELLKEEYRISQQTQNEKPAKEVVKGGSPVMKMKEMVPLGHRASSDSDILKNCDQDSLENQRAHQEALLRTGIDGSSRNRALMSTSSSYPELSHALKADCPRLVSLVGNGTVNFVQLRETLKLQMNFPGYFYSECPTLASTIPYFQVPGNVDSFGTGMHLIVCVHGLDGNSADLRLVRTYMEMALPGFRLDFLMSERNQQDTFADFDKMTDRLVDEVLNYLDTFGFNVTRISFVGHSLGNIIIRSCLSRPKIAHLLPKLHTFLSLSGPHLGTLYNTSGLVNMGMWFMQKWKKSGSLLQLSLKDHTDPRQTFLYQLSQKPVLQHFKNVLLVGSHQDRYVPYHSSRIEICRAAQKDSSITGSVYREMVQNILEPVIQSPQTTLVRYDVFHSLPSTANTMIGRAAHIAVLDSEIFIEKFLTVSGLKYFQ